MWSISPALMHTVPHPLQYSTQWTDYGGLSLYMTVFYPLVPQTNHMPVQDKISWYDKPASLGSTIRGHLCPCPCRRGIPALMFTFPHLVWKICTDWARHLAGDTRDATIGPVYIPSLWKCNQLLEVCWSTLLQNLAILSGCCTIHKQW